MIWAELTAAYWMLKAIVGEVGAFFSLQLLLSPTQFAKIKNQNVIAENQGEKHIKRFS